MTPYELVGDTLRHRGGPAGGPSFEIDWSKKKIRHLEENEEVPTPGGEKEAKRAEAEESLELGGRASASPEGKGKPK